MKRIVLLTGANGHLGLNIAQQLTAQGSHVRGLVLPGENVSMLESMGVKVYRGDVLKPESLNPMFDGLTGQQVVVIHAAAKVDITSEMNQDTRQVNVCGTENMVRLVQKHKVYRFIYVSSVHAIPEMTGRRVIQETKDFSPDTVHGGYSKTKAEASRYVMEQIQGNCLPAIILHPSGMLGPMDSGTNHIILALKGYLDGRIPALPRGGYDIVDVRDVAAACISAIDKGRVGETYILSGRHYEIADLFAMLCEVASIKQRRCPVIPMWMVRLAAPVLAWWDKRKSRTPLITPYALDTLTSNDNFSHQKASQELGFWPRDIRETLRDTAKWLKG